MNTTCIAALARYRKSRAGQLGHAPGDAYDITKDHKWLFDWQGQGKKDLCLWHYGGAAPWRRAVTPCPTVVVVVVVVVVAWLKPLTDLEYPAPFAIILKPWEFGDRLTRNTHQYAIFILYILLYIYNYIYLYIERDTYIIIIYHDIYISQLYVYVFYECVNRHIYFYVFILIYIYTYAIICIYTYITWFCPIGRPSTATPWQSYSTIQVMVFVGFNSHFLSLMQIYSPVFFVYLEVEYSGLTVCLVVLFNWGSRWIARLDKKQCKTTLFISCELCKNSHRTIAETLLELNNLLKSNTLVDISSKTHWYWMSFVISQSHLHLYNQY